MNECLPLPPDDRIIAEYEAKVKLYKETKAKVVGIPDKVRKTYQDQKDKIDANIAKVRKSIEDLQKTGDELAKAAAQAEELAKKALEAKKKAGLIMDDVSDDEAPSRPRFEKVGDGTAGTEMTASHKRPLLHDTGTN